MFERDAGKRLLDLVFERPPNLIRLAVADLETGERAFYWWTKHLDRTVQNAEDIPGARVAGVSGERVAAGDTFGRLDDPGAAETLEYLFQIVLGKMFGFGEDADRQRPISMGEGDRGPKPVVSLF